VAGSAACQLMASLGEARSEAAKSISHPIQLLEKDGNDQA